MANMTSIDKRQLSKEKENQYSDRYIAIKKEAESDWPSWKVLAYNSNIAVSSHAKKIINK